MLLPSRRILLIKVIILFLQVLSIVVQLFLQLWSIQIKGFFCCLSRLCALYIT